MASSNAIVPANSGPLGSASSSGPLPQQQVAVPTEGPSGVVQFDRVLFLVSLVFWLCIDFLGLYSIIVETGNKTDVHADAWTLIHDVAAGALMIVMSLLG